MLLDKIPVRARLSFGHTIWMAAIFILLGTVVYRVVEDNLLENLDTSLLISARSIRDARYATKRNLADIIMDELYGSQRFGIHAQLIDISGHVTAKTQHMRINLPVTPRAVARAEQGLDTFETFNLNSVVLRQVTIPVFRKGGFKGELIQVGTPMDNTYDTLQNIKRLLIVSLSLCFLISITFGYLLTRWAFKPVVRITKAASRLGVNDLDVRLKLPPAQDELRDLTSTLNSMLDRLEDAFKRLRQFSGNVSHELRTPLAVLRGEVELALRKDRPKEEYKEALETIARESTHMSQIVEDLLLLAKAQGNAINVSRTKVFVPEFINELVESLEPIYRAKNIDFVIDNRFDDYLALSPAYFSLALKNIILNAINHSKTDQRVNFIIKRENTSVLFIVQDFGDGIPAEALPYIFDAFYRADTARNRSLGGAGIGLSLSHALIKLHNGEIRVESEVNKGTTFTIAIPMEPSPRTASDGKKAAKSPLLKRAPV
jgi:heavy metal sensor kinase